MLFCFSIQLPQPKRCQPDSGLDDTAQCVKLQMSQFMEFTKRASNGIVVPEAGSISSRPTSVLVPFQPPTTVDDCYSADERTITIERTDESQSKDFEAPHFVRYSNICFDESNHSQSNDYEQRKMTYLSTSSPSNERSLVSVTRNDSGDDADEPLFKPRPPSYVNLADITDADYYRYQNDDEINQNRDRIIQEYCCGDKKEGTRVLIDLYLERWREEQRLNIPKTPICFVGIEDAVNEDSKMDRKPLHIIRTTERKRKSRIQTNDKRTRRSNHSDKSRRSKRKRSSTKSKTVSTKSKTSRSTLSAQCSRRRKRKQKEDRVQPTETPLVSRKPTMKTHDYDRQFSFGEAVELKQNGDRAISNSSRSRNGTASKRKKLKNGVSIPPIITSLEGNEEEERCQRVARRLERTAKRSRKRSDDHKPMATLYHWTKSAEFTRVMEEEGAGARHVPYSMGASPRPRHRPIPSYCNSAQELHAGMPHSGEGLIPKPRASIVEKTWPWRDVGDQPVPRPYIVSSESLYERDCHSLYSDRSHRERRHHVVLAKSP